MQKSSSITSALAKESPLFSVEFFPPKDDAGGQRMLDTVAAIHPYQPDFVSITYGAGGGTSCLLYTSPSPRDQRGSRMPSSA